MTSTTNIVNVEVGLIDNLFNLTVPVMSALNEDINKNTVNEISEVITTIEESENTIVSDEGHPNYVGMISVIVVLVVVIGALFVWRRMRREAPVESNGEWQQVDFCAASTAMAGLQESHGGVGKARTTQDVANV